MLRSKAHDMPVDVSEALHVVIELGAVREAPTLRLELRFIDRQEGLLALNDDLVRQPAALLCRRALALPIRHTPNTPNARRAAHPTAAA